MVVYISVVVVVKFKQQSTHQIHSFFVASQKEQELDEFKREAQRSQQISGFIYSQIQQRLS